ncbi:MAG: putative dinitrogen iron-molybdenum cofactor biosynthesis protein [Deltaproteobacteria bacterium]|nr:putative dinitrogen iron-molybdenum cofactor biosynthesis protein [Deltaproteobacteria bacterium]
MKLCFAVTKDEGAESAVYGHFGSAPAFIVVNTEDNVMSKIVNSDMNHIHGACNPMKAIGGTEVDAVVVGGIGAGALTRLNAEGIKVFKAVGNTIKDNLALHKENRLPELTINHTCGGHAGECAHH